MITAFFIALLYFILLLAAEAATLQLYLPPLLMWAPNLIYLLWGLILTLRICAY